MTNSIGKIDTVNFGLLFAKMQLPVLLVDSSSKVLEVNEAAANLLGMTVEEVSDQYWAGLDGQCTIINWKQRLLKIGQQGHFRYTTDLVSGGDLLRPVDVELVRITSDLTLILVRDLLARVIDEDDLEQLGAESAVGFWSYNRVDNRLYLSPYLRTLLPVAEGQNAADTVAVLQQHLLPSDWDRLRRKFEKRVEEAGDFSQLIHFEGKEGTLPLHCFVRSVGNALHVTRLFGVIRSEADQLRTETQDSIPGELATFSIDQATDLIFWTRPNGTVSYANQAVADMLGYSAEEMRGMHASKFTEGFGDEARIAWWDYLREFKSHQAVWTVKDKSGRKFLLDAKVTYLRFGEEEYTCGFCRDITETQRKARRSKLSEYTIDHSRDMVLWTRTDGSIYFANKPFQERTGLDWSAISQMELRNFFPQIDVDYLQDFWQKLRVGASAEAELELTVKKKKTKQIPVLMRSSYFDFEGEAYNCIYLRDISKRKKRDTELALTHEALDTAADFIIWLDEEFNIRYANQTILKLVGKSLTDVLGKSHKLLFPLLGRKQITQRAPLDAILRSTTAADRKLSLNCSIISSNGRRYYMLVGRDFTELERRQQALEAAYAEITALKDRLEESNENLKEEVNIKYNHNQIITVSPKYQKVLKQVGQVAGVETTVLITGETGTGKELLARSIHRLSDRTDEPLIKVNCATLPENLIESELFGHEKGAFTGAIARKKGRFEMAHNGTLFLDEVGELPLDLQAKLLRVLQEDEFERLGGTETIKVNVRLVAATNRDLKAMVKAGTFRADLYYRLNVFPIVNLPLRERPEDIPVLVKHFVNKFARRQNKEILEINGADLKRLERYHFPGNIRELENIVERAVVLCRSSVLSIPFNVTQSAATEEEDFATLEEIQRRHILKALRRTEGRVTGPNGAGILLGMKDRTLVSRMRKLGIQRHDYLR